MHVTTNTIATRTLRSTSDGVGAIVTPRGSTCALWPVNLAHASFVLQASYKSPAKSTDTPRLSQYSQELVRWTLYGRGMSLLLQQWANRGRQRAQSLPPQRIQPLVDLPELELVSPLSQNAKIGDRRLSETSYREGSRGRSPQARHRGRPSSAVHLSYGIAAADSDDESQQQQQQQQHHRLVHRTSSPTFYTAKSDSSRRGREHSTRRADAVKCASVPPNMHSRVFDWRGFVRISMLTSFAKGEVLSIFLPAISCPHT